MAQEATQVSLVQSGVGVALVPSVRALAARGVVFRPVEGLPASATIAMASRVEGRNAAAARFRELALAALSAPRPRARRLA